MEPEPTDTQNQRDETLKSFFVPISDPRLHSDAHNKIVEHLRALLSEKCQWTPEHSHTGVFGRLKHSSGLAVSWEIDSKSGDLWVRIPGSEEGCHVRQPDLRLAFSCLRAFLVEDSLLTFLKSLPQ